MPLEAAIAFIKKSIIVTPFRNDLANEPCCVGSFLQYVNHPSVHSLVGSLGIINSTAFVYRFPRYIHALLQFHPSIVRMPSLPKLWHVLKKNKCHLTSRTCLLYVPAAGSVAPIKRGTDTKSFGLIIHRVRHARKPRHVRHNAASDRHQTRHTRQNAGSDMHQIARHACQAKRPCRQGDWHQHRSTLNTVAVLAQAEFDLSTGISH